MSKKAFIAAFTIPLILVALYSILSPGLAKANPFYPTSPNKDPPIVTVDSVTQVRNGSRDLAVIFRVTYPDSWLGDTFDRVDRVYYQIDDQPGITLYDLASANGSGYQNITGYLKMETTFTINIYNLSVGQHSLAINAHSDSLYVPPPYPPNWFVKSHYYSTVMQNVTIAFDEKYVMQWLVPTPTPVTQSSQANQQSQSEIATPEPTAAAPPYAVLLFSPSISLSPAPTTPPKPSPSPTLPPETTFTESPTQQPTPTPAFTGSNVRADPMVNYTPALVALSTIIVTVVLGVAAYIYFRKRSQQLFKPTLFWAI